MSRSSPVRSILRSAGLPAIAIIAMGFFAYNAVLGPNGVLALKDVKAEVAAKNVEYAALEKQRAVIQNRVNLLDSKHGADPEIRNDNGQSPVAGAAFKGDLGVVQALIEHGADIEGAAADGRTALMMAAMFNRTEIVDYLLAKGADPRAQDAQGITALGAAKAMGAVDTIAQLEKLSA